ncbi:hypothetical protein BGZ57DRAFT_1009152 [Hyaloscypha finlandica]|nr:hypothetical protein BGZ57DRAFT_1009152 [Hyaloscypha finlandica]
MFNLQMRRPQNSQDIAALFSANPSMKVMGTSLRHAHESEELLEQVEDIDIGSEEGDMDPNSENTGNIELERLERDDINQSWKILAEFINAGGVSLSTILRSQIGEVRWHVLCHLYGIIRPDKVFDQKLKDITMSAGSDIHTPEELYFEPGSYLELIPCSDDKYFWTLWNDCTITINPKDFKVYLLQTLPGQHFRKTFASFDELTALRLFRKEIDHISTSNEARIMLQRALGPGYKVEYELIMQYIPREQFSTISKEDFGEGSSGAITAVVWRRLVSMEHKFAKEIPVVLKRIRNKYPPGESFNRFIHEIIIQALCGVIGGLKNLHDRNVLHRDLHPGNILMTFHPDPESEHGPAEGSVYLCDFGLGKLIADESTSSFGGNLGCTRYRAPELANTSEYTKSADIYSVGIFIRDILANSARLLPVSSPAPIPRKL